ncbi:MAG: 4-hydroxythreonine-4-phosphate dehydrogenase PdxA [Rhodospirillaceae bacterium]|nr:4-hydroxythreonine-4-phosphate dehydrogenase PdxA [Rhodospirillaceae bacterium]
MDGNNEPPLVLTPGEPSGVGAEIALKAWRSAPPVFFLIDDPDRVRSIARELRVSVEVIDSPTGAEEAFRSGLPVMPHHFPVDPVPGAPDPANGSAVIDAIRDAVALVGNGKAGAVVTNPIQKSTLHMAGFLHPGHTEYLANLAGSDRSVMMLACDTVRVVPVTIHEAIRDVPTLLTRELIVETARITASSLKHDFGIRAPRLVVAGLNPHAGEAGSIGFEDQEVISPAIETLRDEAIEVTGPLAADSMFHEAVRGTYDAAICMYHDQALIPIKTIDFWGSVNVTIGLPFVRTSPDHGTALNLAGTGLADERSLLAALHMADKIRRQRATAT